MKDDVISRVAAADIVRFECGEWRGLAKTIIDEFEALPTVDAVPVVHGEWVDDGDPLTLVCGVCSYRVMRYNNTRFCPDCGAKMDEKDGDHHAYNQ